MAAITTASVTLGMLSPNGTQARGTAVPFSRVTLLDSGGVALGITTAGPDGHWRMSFPTSVAGRAASVTSVPPGSADVFSPPSAGSGAAVVVPVVTLNALTISAPGATVGTAYTGTVSGKTAGSTLSLAGAGAPGLSVSGTTISGTPTTVGAVNVVEALSGATNSPNPSNGLITVAPAAVVNALLLEDGTPLLLEDGTPLLLEAA